MARERSAKPPWPMRGMKRAYWLPPYDPAMLTGAAVFATAAREARLEAIVKCRHCRRPREWKLLFERKHLTRHQRLS